MTSAPVPPRPAPDLGAGAGAGSASPHALVSGTQAEIDFLAFMIWILLHASWMLLLLAVVNAHDWTMRYVMHFGADIFALLNSFIYLHKASLELQRCHTRLSFAGFLTQVALNGLFFAMTLTVAAPAFPLVVIALVPVRLTVMKRIWSSETLRFVDAWACRPETPEDSHGGNMPQAVNTHAQDDEEKG